MARDVRDFSKVVHVIRTWSGNVVGDNSYTNIITRSARDDPKATVPNGGVYYKPTDYWARFFYGNGGAIDFRYRNASGVKYEVTGESPADLCSVQLSPTYGCSGSTQLPSISQATRSRAASNIQSQVLTGNWNVGQDIGEAPELIRSVASGLEFIVDLIGILRGKQPPAKIIDFVYKRSIKTTAFSTKYSRVQLRRHLRMAKPQIVKATLSARNTADAAASLWLVYQFAWKPVLNSVYESLQLIERGINHPLAYRAYTKVEEPLDEPVPRSGTKFIDKSFKAEREFTVEVTCQLSSPQLYDLKLLGLTDPMAIAWELLPMSFVLDWFIPVGNFIAAIQGPLGLQFLTGYETAYLHWHYKATYIPFGMTLFAEGKFPSYRANLTAFNRSALFGFPMPTPYFRGFGDQLKMGQLISLLALTVQKSL